jgi:hypothetical protein
VIAIELKLNLPDNLARQAEGAGLLTPDGVRHLVEAELRRRSADHFFDTADRLADLDLPPLSDDEIQAEIDAARAERRASGAGSR